MRKKILLLSLPLVFALTSCGLFKESCNCPKFGKSPVKATENTKIAAEKSAQNLH